MQGIVKDILIPILVILFGLSLHRPRTAFKIAVSLLIFVAGNYLLLKYEGSSCQKDQAHLAERVAQSWSPLDSIQGPIASKSSQRALIKVRANINELLQHDLEDTATRLEEQQNIFLMACLLLLALSAFCLLLMTAKNRRSS